MSPYFPQGEVVSIYNSHHRSDRSIFCFLYTFENSVYDGISTNYRAWPVEVRNRKDALLHRIHLTPNSKQIRLEKTWELIGTIERATNAGEIKAHLLEIASASGLSSLFAGWIPSLRLPLSPPEVAAKIFHDHAPEEWSQRYLAQGYVLRDPIVARLQQHRTPFTWADAYDACPSRDDVSLIDGEASDFGLRHGYVVPVVLLGDLSLAFSFGGPVIDLDPESLSSLTFITNVAAGHLINLVRSRSSESGRDLTGREVECLSWAAEGKTDWEIATIMGISRLTVIKHLAAARDKLEAVNKFHAVAKALRLKIIQ